MAPTARHPRLRQVQVTAGPCVYDAIHRVLEGRSWAEAPEQGGLGAHQAAACKTSRQGLGLELPVSAPSVRPSDAQARLLRLLDAPAQVALRGRTVRDTCSTTAGDGSSLLSKHPQIAHRERTCRPGGRQSRQPPRRQTRGREHSCVRCANSKMLSGSRGALAPLQVTGADAPCPQGEGGRQPHEAAMAAG